MIPTIGIMLAAYIFTRMVELVDKKEVRMGVKLFAVLTLLITVMCAASLLLSGASDLGGRIR